RQLGFYPEKNSKNGIQTQITQIEKLSLLPYTSNYKIIHFLYEKINLSSFTPPLIQEVDTYTNSNVLGNKLLNTVRNELFLEYLEELESHSHHRKRTVI